MKKPIDVDELLCRRYGATIEAAARILAPKGAFLEFEPEPTPPTRAAQAPAVSDAQERGIYVSHDIGWIGG